MPPMWLCPLPMHIIAAGSCGCSGASEATATIPKPDLAPGDSMPKPLSAPEVTTLEFNSGPREDCNRGEGERTTPGLAAAAEVWLWWLRLGVWSGASGTEEATCKPPVPVTVGSALGDSRGRTT
mmetsp:Transcript_33599/g.74412  ORF Transcript_33599/g.74412 Transcript_33599/m.74412 type:complete len:124 (-) Transcript_33599:2179-2550(-)